MDRMDDLTLEQILTLPHPHPGAVEDWRGEVPDIRDSVMVRITAGSVLHVDPKTVAVRIWKSKWEDADGDEEAMTVFAAMAFAMKARAEAAEAHIRHVDEFDKEIERRRVAWIDKHDVRHAGQKTGAIAGRYSTVYTPTSIGTIVSVRCACGESKLLTDDP